MKAGHDYYWEWLGNQDAYRFDGYGFAATTYYDSTATDPAMHYFQVIAHTADRWTFWTSPPDSGYSVDNLPPEIPAGFTVVYGADNQLFWEPCEEEDFQQFLI